MARGLTRVVLVEEDAVVVLATSVTTTAGVLPVLADTAVAGRHVPPLLPVLVFPGRLGDGRTEVGEREGGG